jgi:hypothetical protein
VPERFSGGNICDVDFNDRDFDGRDGVANGNGRMCISPRVKYNSCNAVRCSRLQPINKFAFVIALKEG